MSELIAASFVAMVEVDLADGPDLHGPWLPGPARFARNMADGRLEFDAAHRLGYFASRIEPSLYPVRGRFWRTVSLPSRSAEPIRGVLELLVAPFRVAEEQPCVLVLHAPSTTLRIDEVPGECTAAREALIEWVSDQLAPVSRSGRELTLFFVATPAARNLDEVTVRVGAEFGRRGPTRAKATEAVAQARTTGRLTDVGSAGRLLVERHVVVLATAGGGEHPEPFDRWSRNEAATPTGVFTELAQQRLHTIYSDCGLIAVLQRSGLNRIADRFATLASRQPSIRQMMALERSFARFKSAVWWRLVTEADEGNRIVQTLQDLHNLEAFRDDVGRDLAHYAEQLQTLNAARSTAAVTVLTLVLFPLTVLVEWVAFSIPDSWAPPLVGIAFLLTVPTAIALGWAIAWAIPGYLHFLRDVFGAVSRRS